MAELAQRYNTTVATARKWRGRDDMWDRSRRPNKPSTALTQEVLVVELRRTLLLLDDLLAITSEFINSEVSRSGLDLRLRRRGASTLASLMPVVEGEAAAKKTFNLERAVGRTRVACDGVRWQVWSSEFGQHAARLRNGQRVQALTRSARATTLWAHAHEEEQRRSIGCVAPSPKRRRLLTTQSSVFMGNSQKAQAINCSF